MSKLKCIAVTDDGDFDTSNGRLQYAVNLEAAEMIIRSNVATQLSEYKYDQTKGIEYENNIFANAPDIALFKHQVSKLVNNIGFVDNIKSFTTSVDRSSDKPILSYTLTLVTDYGTTTTEREI